MSSVLKYRDFVGPISNDICLIAEGNVDLQHTVDKVYTTGLDLGWRSTEQRLQCIALDERNSE